MAKTRQKQKDDKTLASNGNRWRPIRTHTPARDIMDERKRTHRKALEARICIRRRIRERTDNNLHNEIRNQTRPKTQTLHANSIGEQRDRQRLYRKPTGKNA